jgi:hypothetical protein
MPEKACSKQTGTSASIAANVGLREIVAIER